jgi:hypothetical protein
MLFAQRHDRNSFVRDLPDGGIWCKRLISSVTLVIVLLRQRPVFNWDMRILPISILFLAAFSGVGLSQNAHKPGVEVALHRQDPLRLRVTLTSGAATTATIYHAELPWGIRDSMIFSAVRPNGESIDLIFPTDDPGPNEISIKPREALTGEIDLRYVIRDMNVLKKSDVLLFWAYKAPDALHLPHWTGGLVVIPKQK